MSDNSPYPVWREETGQKLGSPDEVVLAGLLELGRIEAKIHDVGVVRMASFSSMAMKGE